MGMWRNLDSASGFGPDGCGFKSRHARHIAGFIYDWIVAIVILLTSLIVVNSITSGRSDLGVWSMDILEVVSVFIGIIMWFGGD